MPSGAEGGFPGCALVLPSRFFALKSSSLPSSYQFDCFVASFVVTNGAAPELVFASSSASPRVWFAADDAVTAAFLRLLLMRRPSSSSEDVKSESESEAGGGETAFLRKLALALAERFLKVTWGTSAATSASSAMVEARVGEKARSCEAAELLSLAGGEQPYPR